MPKVSVVMSVYNGTRYLKEAIDSILNQSFTDFECIVINDASTDATLEVLQEYAKKDSRVKIITNEKNIGLTRSLNKGVQEAKGEYVARMDADDISFPTRLKKQIKFLDDHKEYGVVGAWAKVIDEEGKEVDEFVYEETDKEIRNNLIKWNPIIHSLALIRKSILEKIGGYNEDFPYAQDYELWFRIAKISKMANLPEFLLHYRISRKSITASKNKKQAMCALRARLSAIKSGLYSPFASVYLLRPILSIILPKKLKDFYK